MKLTSLVRIWKHIKKTIIRLFSLDYIKFYKRWMDSRVSDNPLSAPTDIGWEIGGRIQFEFLKEIGLKPHHNFLDLGCGTLSLGQFLIPFLDIDNYVGMDISQDAILAGRGLVEDLSIGRFTRFIVNEDLIFDNPKVEEKFDFIWSHSVFNHLPIKYFYEFVENVKKISTNNCRILITVRIGEFSGPVGLIPHSSFSYSLNDIHSWLQKFGYSYRIVDTGDHWCGYRYDLDVIEIMRNEK